MSLFLSVLCLLQPINDCSFRDEAIILNYLRYDVWIVVLFLCCMCAFYTLIQWSPLGKWTRFLIDIKETLLHCILPETQDQRANDPAFYISFCDANSSEYI